MSELVVVTFTSEEAGREALARVRALQDSGAVDLQDSAVILKDAEGKTHVTNQISSGAKTGALVGGILGMMFSLFFLPVFGLVAGATAGVIFGRSVSMNVDQDFVKDVTDELQPGTSALFVVVKGNVGALTSALEPFKGRVHQTTLDPDLENSLNEALRTGR
ncbi:MAG: DUF1269 domain-containing protein [Chloroflexota bacterium]